jgi:hypothetical protein
LTHNNRIFYNFIKTPVMQSSRLKTSLVWLALFSIAMGYLESSVVIYLRQLYYPEGFNFPLKQLSCKITLTEIGREAATMIMLAAVAWIAGEKFWQRLALFFFCFATWDIFYYVFLKILSGWPESLFTWDILFLIPLVWSGPVIAPVIVSITMMVIAVIILFNHDSIADRRVLSFSNLLVTGGILLVFFSFIFDFLKFAISRRDLHEILLSNLNSVLIQQYVPVSFNWFLFIAGELLLITGVLIHFSLVRFSGQKNGTPFNASR